MFRSSLDNIRRNKDYLDLDPNLELWKDCEVGLETIDGKLVVVVYFTGGVKDTGDVPLTITVTDDKFGGIVFGPNTMDPCEIALISEHSYLPEMANSGETLPCKAEFSDTFTAVCASPIPGVPDQNEVITATCPLCPEECPD